MACCSRACLRYEMQPCCPFAQNVFWSVTAVDAHTASVHDLTLHQTLSSLARRVTVSNEETFDVAVALGYALRR